MNAIIETIHGRMAAKIFLALMMMAIVASAACSLATIEAQTAAQTDEKSATNQADEKAASGETPDSGTNAATVKDETASSDEKADEKSDEKADEKSDGDSKEKKVDFSPIDGQFRDLKLLSRKGEGEVWFSPTDKVVLVGGMICLNRGQLEMFACTPGTKEHESIVVINGKAFDLHVGLLAIGAKSGTRVEWDPEYRPPTGEEIVVEVHWFDESGMAQKANAQEWIQDSRTKKQMEYSWVFAGSDFFVDEDSGQKFYMAEGGEVICVSNFSTAMLDLPTKSDDVDDGLLFSAFTERIPELRTPVRIVLRMKTKDEKESEKKKPKKEKAEEKKPDSVDGETKESPKSDDSATEKKESEEASDEKPADAAE